MYRVAAALLVGAVTPAVCSAPEDGVLAGLDITAVQQWSLPSRLREVSGLALTADRRLLAVDDEQAIVYELDYVSGGMIKAFALGNPVERDDFEGIAELDGTIYLLTSKGRIYAAPEGGDGERVTYERYRTRLDDECEFEGLASDPRAGRLLLLCKNRLKSADQIEELSIFAWDVAVREIRGSETLAIPVADIERSLSVQGLRPSGIAVAGDALLIVAARERALIEIARDGAFRDAILLAPAARHPQAEGIVIDEEGRLIIADEGGSGRARLSVYRPRGGLLREEQER